MYIPLPADENIGFWTFRQKGEEEGRKLIEREEDGPGRTHRRRRPRNAVACREGVDRQGCAVDKAVSTACTGRIEKQQRACSWKRE